MLRWLTEEQKIEPHVSVVDESTRQDGSFSPADSPMTLKTTLRGCSEGKTLTTSGTVVIEGTTRIYPSSTFDCDSCHLKERCCPNTPARKISRSIYEQARELARSRAVAWVRGSVMGLITYLTTIRFDLGASRELPADMADLAIARPLLVTDPGVIAAGLVDRVTAQSELLEQAPVFDAVPTNPTEEAVEAALEVYREHDCDGLVAIGGGSPIDLAKAVALLATHHEPLVHYAAILGGLPRITSAVAPLIAVPTTAGTGSEVGRAALITLRDGRKLGFISPHLIPRLAVCDPELTLGLPPGLTAATGMDALTHCVETYLSPRDNPRPRQSRSMGSPARCGSWKEPSNAGVTLKRGAR